MLDLSQVRLLHVSLAHECIVYLNYKICLPQESDFAELRSNVISIPATIPKRLPSTVF